MRVSAEDQEELDSLRKRELFGNVDVLSDKHRFSYSWVSTDFSRMSRRDIRTAGLFVQPRPTIAEDTPPVALEVDQALVIPDGPEFPPEEDDTNEVVLSDSDDSDDSDIDVAAAAGDPAAGNEGGGTGHIPANANGDAELTPEIAAEFPPHLRTTGARNLALRRSVRKETGGEELRTDLLHPDSLKFISGDFESGWKRQFQRAVREEFRAAKKRAGGRRRRRRAAKSARKQG